MSGKGVGARRYELVQLARWVGQRFHLSAKPQIHTATESEVIYAEILRRLGALGPPVAGAVEAPPAAEEQS